MSSDIRHAKCNFMRSSVGSIIIIAICVLIDWYVFTVVKTLSLQVSNRVKMIGCSIFWTVSVMTVISVALLPYVDFASWQRSFRTYFFAIMVGLFLAKLIAVFFF